MPEQFRDSPTTAKKWKAYPPKQEGDGWGIYVEGTGRMIDPCIAETLADYDPEVEEAHAKLLAAAPDLADVMEEIRLSCYRMGTGSGIKLSNTSAKALLKALEAKARAALKNAGRIS